MAKPLVLIFQELAQPTATPVVPDLRTVIIGPAYDVKDYLDDGEDLLLPSAYGTADTANPYTPPATGTDAVVLNEGAYPEQSAGARVDHASVRVTLKTPRVVLGVTAVIGTITVLGTGVTTTTGDRTLITLNGMVASGFITAGIQPGDRVVLTSSASQTCVRVVSTVGEPNGAGLVPGGNENLLRLTQELPASGVATDQWTYDGAGEMRIERVLATQDLIDTGSWITFPVPSSDRLVVRGGVTINIPLTPRPTVATPTPTTTTVARFLSYAQLYIGYRALRQDLAGLATAQPTAETTVDGIPTITGIGKIDARNPLAVAVKLALANGGGAPIDYYGVTSDDSTGYASALARLSSPDLPLYCYVPLTRDINVLGAYKTAFESQASTTTATTTGVRQRFRIVLGTVPLPVTTTVYAGSLDGVASAVAGTGTGLRRTFVIANASTGSNLAFANVLPGDTLTIGLQRVGAADWSNRRGVHGIGHVNASHALGVTNGSLEVVPGSSRWDDAGAAASDDVEFRIVSPDGATRAENLAEESISTGAGLTLGTVRYVMRNPTTSGGPYTITYAASGGLAAVTIAIVGFAVTITVNGTSHDHDAVAAAVTAHATLGALMTATVTAGGAQVVDPPTQATRTPVSGQTGLAASIVATVPPVAGRMRVTGVTGMVAASVGRYLTITGAASAANNGTWLIAVVNSATSVDVVNAGAVIPDANNGALAWTERYPYTEVRPLLGTCTATIIENDTLYNQLDDASATFLAAGVRAGDTVEMPLDPNDYTPTAYDGRTLTCLVGSVLSETRLRISNGLDDSASVAQELPHFYARDVRNRLIDNTAPNAISYRIRRALTTSARVLALAATSLSVRSKRLTLGFPPEVGVADLRDGSLTRSTPTVRTLAGLVPGWALMAAVGGAIAGIPPQMGLTGGSFIGIDRTPNTTDLFSPEELAQVGDAGYFVCTIAAAGALPVCDHQLTTDPTALETGELSIVKNVDYLSIYFQTLLRSYLGRYNNVPESLNEIRRAIEDNATLLAGRRVARIGAPLVSGTVDSIALSTTSPDAVEVYFSARIPVPINRISFHLVVATR